MSTETSSAAGHRARLQTILDHEPGILTADEEAALRGILTDHAAMANELSALQADRVSRELEDRHIDRTLGMLLMRLGGSVEFSQAEMENAPAHGEFVAMKNLATGGTRLAFEPRSETPGEATP